MALCETSKTVCAGGIGFRFDVQDMSARSLGSLLMKSTSERL
jgi:hypothetical protein